METKKENEVKKVWVKPELKIEDINVTEVKGVYRREGATYRT